MQMFLFYQKSRPEVTRLRNIHCKGFGICSLVEIILRAYEVYGYGYSMTQQVLSISTSTNFCLLLNFFKTKFQTTHLYQSGSKVRRNCRQ